MKNVIDIISLKSVFIWLLIAFCVGSIAFLFFVNGKSKRKTVLGLSILAFYLSFVFTLTVFSRLPSNNAQYNIVLFWTYRAIVCGNNGLISEILWNVVLFIPIGILLKIILVTKNKWVIDIAISLILSSSIELIQLYSHRGLFEFDDIVHNTLGAVIGVGICSLVRFCAKILKSKRRY